ncbi:uncharacterized protein LOC131326861 [Rhododendron vialii]|uniref:uncharacterized protein LOC131326861 n=1 Tax=Rhododendron vialii TaxID=182163 RepID=UPI00265F36E5|nr:uncharacterized protein LOC131326861 [Rhododendron vialii]
MVLPRLSWTLTVRDAQGEEAIVWFEPARTEPAEIIGPAPMEWVQEAVRLMKAMEKEFHKIVGGASLQLHYPLPAPALAVQPQGRARAAPRRKSVGPPPQKKIAPSSSRPAASVQRGVQITPASEELQFRRELRKRPAGKRPAEGPSQKKRREEEEEEEEEQTSLSSGSDSADDPRFRMDPREMEESKEDDDEDFFDD